MTAADTASRGKRIHRPSRRTNGPRIGHGLLSAVMETLEERCLLSFTVTSLADNGASGTLRWAIQQADSARGNQTIIFSSTLTNNGPATINLNSALILADPSGTLTIQGPASGSLSISGQNESRVFVVNCNAVISNLTISGGKESGNGGGIYNTAVLTLQDCTLTGNQASGNGGAIDNIGTLTIRNSTICGNTATNGGGIYNNGTLAVTDATISGNSAQSQGGGIQNASSAAAVLNGTIVALDTSGGDLSGAFAGSYDIIADDTGQFSANTSSDIDPANPQLAPLANNGGPTETMALQTDSPAIGHGSTFSGITTDQRGDPRPSVDPDIGAYQTQQPLIVVGQTITATSGQTFSGNVAFAIYPAAADNGTEPNELTALIHWGDGSVSGGTIAVGYQDFTVSGIHKYSTPGTYYPLITITAASQNDQAYSSAQATATVNVGLPLVTLFQVNSGNAQRTTVTSLTLNLSQPLALTTSSFTLMETATTNSVSPHPEPFVLTPSNGNKTYTLTFPQSSFAEDVANSLPSGTYTLTLLGFGAGAATQSNPQFNFYCDSSGASDAPTVSLPSIPAASAALPSPSRPTPRPTAITAIY